MSWGEQDCGSGVSGDTITISGMVGGQQIVGPGDRRDVPIEFFKLPKCEKTFRLSPGSKQEWPTLAKIKPAREGHPGGLGCATRQACTRSRDTSWLVSKSRQTSCFGYLKNTDSADISNRVTTINSDWGMNIPLASAAAYS
jgi:hypothetical protein